MKKRVLIQLLVIVTGLLAGVFLSKRSTLLHEISGHEIPIVHTNMDHGLLDISSDSMISEIVTIHLSKDIMSGWNIHIETRNFKFAPKLVNQDHKAGHGHAHVYINDQKFARIYGPDFHLPELLGKENMLKITLNANGHEALAMGEEAIEYELILQ